MTKAAVTIIDLCSNDEERPPLQEVVVRQNKRGTKTKKNDVARSKRRSKPSSRKTPTIPRVRLSPNNKENQQPFRASNVEEPVSKRRKTRVHVKKLQKEKIQAKKQQDHPKSIAFRTVVDESDEEVAIVEPAQDKWQTDTPTENGDEECMIVGQKGNNALSDFPHSREDCVVHPIDSDDHRAHCPNCFCFVCDISAKSCQHWNIHCIARFKDSFWKKEKEIKAREEDSYAPTGSACLLAAQAESGLDLNRYAARLAQKTPTTATPTPAMSSTARPYSFIMAGQTQVPDPSAPYSTLMGQHYAQQQQLQPPYGQQYPHQYAQYAPAPAGQQPFYANQTPQYVQHPPPPPFNQQYHQQHAQYAPAPGAHPPYYVQQPQPTQYLEQQPPYNQQYQQQNAPYAPVHPPNLPFWS